MKERINGEESNIFQNKLGETIEVQVLGNCNETAFLLEKVLDGDRRAAELLAIEVHRDLGLKDINTNRNVPDESSIDKGNLGIWIDPIGNFSQIDF